MCRIIIILAVFSLMAFNNVSAGAIYTWTDADGVKRYSNSQPPEDAENVQTIEEVPYDGSGADQHRQEFDRMVKDASREADRHFKQQAQEKARQAEAKQRQQQAEKAQQIAAEKARLLKEIEAIQQRAFSPTFTKGMQDNLIREVQEKIDRLESGAGT
jgi:DNA topoisomerase VI subunit B